MSLRTRPRDEEGAVAVMVGLLAVVLVGVCALTVDLGVALVERGDVQQRADFAALAGGAGSNLPGNPGGVSCAGTSGTWRAPAVTDPAVVDTVAYLNLHLPAAKQVTAAQAVDCDLTNGEVAFGRWRTTPPTPPATAATTTFVADPNRLSVLTQPSRVNFGLASVLGFDHVDVTGDATVEIKSQARSTLPLYAFNGCDFGSQTIAQPTNGKSSDGVTLAFPGDRNTSLGLTGLAVTPTSVAEPPAVQLNSTSATLTLTGSSLDRVNAVGFFRSAATPPAPEVVSKVPASPGFTVSGTTSITVPVPTTVASTQDTWFVRLRAPKGNGNGADEWTEVTRNGNPNANDNLAALPFTVGNATLGCAQGSSNGNFGTLDLFNRSAGAPSSGGQVDNIAYNIAHGLQFGLLPYPRAKWTPPSYECVDGQDGVGKTWPTSAGSDGNGTNCVGTKPGLDSIAATKGLVTGVTSPTDGLLQRTGAGTYCPDAYNPGGTTHTTVSPAGPTINNDVLTCFFENGSATVADVSSASYAGGPVISQQIYSSPRFVLVPVLGARPTSGASNRYEVIDFRPGFITDQVASATRGAPGANTTGNGLVWQPNGTAKLQSVNVVFLNNNALHDPPIDENGVYVTYTGSGKKNLTLVD